MNWFLLPLFLCLFGCAGMSPKPETQYISAPVVPDAPRSHPIPRRSVPSDADLKEQVDALSRSLGDLQRTIDKGQVPP